MAAETDEARAAAGAEAIEALDRITRRLRRECPWDRAQDERSIVPHTIEEAYELAEAAGAGDDAKLLDELGDVLFQVHFLALLLEERGAGDLAAVAAGTREKLIRRHPHVFGDAEAADAEAVLGNWDRIKREQEGKPGLFEDVPENLPALLHARKLQRRARSRAAEGADLGVVGEPEPDEVAGRVAGQRGADRGARAGRREWRPRADPAQRAAVEAEIGELLFACVDLARRLRTDPEIALRAASERFRAAAGG